MKRRLFLPLIGVALLGGWLAQAQPTPRPNLFITASASTPQSRTPYTISVEVTVENRGQADSTAGNLELVLKPSGSSANKPKSDVPTMWDPFSQAEPLPALKPGEKKVVNFGTPYAANSAFRNRTGSFKANNIDPTGGDTTVTMTVTVR
ncbi:MAG: hypothetical protein KF760_18535 [Candidatus Eremiobacteraeota bacterium]|nr:hypothetical protein [Candidatus Eremiobacteraeota bacterium]MCW5867349.1 hypothetical protein [Candidatus Eremiobacteraeota bacterium]